VSVVWALLRQSSGTRPVLDMPVGAAVPLSVAVLLALVYALAGLGELTAAVARRLLHPSATERLAAQQARTERLIERTRLAGELHDSIGHALTVTLLQAGAAREVADRDPAFVAGALTAIEDSARHAAADLERVLALLRDSSPPRDAPTLMDVDRLVRSAEAAGARVDVEITGPVVDLPPVVSREGYRIVQEAFTNALRHAGPVPIGLRIDIGEDGVHLFVRNPTPMPAPAGAGTGSGVRGLHHRVAVLGGIAQAGPFEDGWRVAVRLPLVRSA
jgi:signal transduction histidine kinase